MTEQPEISPTVYLSADERRMRLEERVRQLTGMGWRPVQVSEASATLTRGKPVNHILHLILSIITLGAWLVIWGALAMFGGLKEMVVTVDPYGNVFP